MATVNGRDVATLNPTATPWGSDGRAVIEIVERSATTALGEALMVALAAAQHACGLVPARGGLSVPIRAEAPSLGELFAALLDDLQEEAATSRDALSGVRIDGVLRSETGLIGWGMVEIARGEPACWQPIRLTRSVEAEESRERVRLSFALEA